MINPNVELKRIHKRLLSRIWKEGQQLKIRGEDYKEIVNVRFTFRFTPVEETKIQHINVINNEILAKLSLFLPIFEKDANTRQLFLYFPELIKGEPPCNLIYHFLFREGQMNLNVYTRSWDILNKWSTDIHTALYCLSYFCEKTGTKRGTTTFFVGSCHVSMNATLEGKFVGTAHDIIKKTKEEVVQ